MNLVVAKPSQRTLLARKRVHFLAGLILSPLLALLHGVGQDPDFYLASTTTNSTLGIMFCVALGYWMSLRLYAFPGVSSGAYTLLCFSVAYGVFAGAFFLFRLDYSTMLLITGYVATISWFLFVKRQVEGSAPLRMAFVDVGKTIRLLRFADIEWTRLSSPRDFASTMGCIVADLRADLGEEWLKFLSETVLDGTPVYHFKQIEEELSGQMEIEHLSENNFGSLLPNMLYLQIRLILDVALALVIALPLTVALLLLFPVCLIMQGRPFFFTQERMGYRGKPFRIYKIRTMEMALQTRDDSSKPSMRLTKLGAILRRTRVDELPQIINVLRGEMSWIGPRPETMELSKWYESELSFYRYRHIVRPGISGWAQVRQGHVVALDDAMTKLKLDFFYIKKISPWLDLLIAFRTLKIVATGFGWR